MVRPKPEVGGIASLLTISICCSECVEKIPKSNFAKGLLAEMISGNGRVHCQEYCNRKCIYKT